jgi:hypothetical protein
MHRAISSGQNDIIWKCDEICRDEDLLHFLRFLDEIQWYMIVLCQKELNQISCEALSDIHFYQIFLDSVPIDNPEKLSPLSAFFRWSDRNEVTAVVSRKGYRRSKRIRVKTFNTGGQNALIPKLARGRIGLADRTRADRDRLNGDLPNYLTR